MISELHAAFVKMHRRFEASDFQESEVDGLLYGMKRLASRIAGTLPLNVEEFRLQRETARLAAA